MLAGKAKASFTRDYSIVYVIETLLLHEVYSAERFKTRPDAWQRYHARAHTSTDELALLATRARPRQLVLYHQLYWGTDDLGLLAELRRAGYTGPSLSARDLGVY